MKRKLLILVCLSFVTYSLMSVVVVCETNLPVKITDLDVYAKSPAIKSVRFPSISDDGTKVAFIAILEYESSNDEITFLDYDSAEIFVINSDGSNLKQVTDSTAQGAIPRLACSISGDGSKIVFAGEKDYNSPNPQSGIFIVNSDGSELKQVTNQTSYSSPSINNDGSKVVFTAKSNRNIDLFVVNSDGTDLKQLTSGSSWDYYPSISDDGRKIAFISGSDDAVELFMINSDGSGLQQLTDKKLDLGTACSSISGDGSKIIVRSTTDKGSNHGLFVVNSDGSEWHQLETNEAGWPNYIYPWSLSHDGSKIVVLVQETARARTFVVDSDVSLTEPGPVIDYLVALVLGVVAIVVLVVIVLRRKKLQTS